MTKPIRSRIVKNGKGTWGPMKWALTLTAVLFLISVLILPLLTVFQTAFRNGMAAYTEAIASPDTLHALLLTLLAAGVAVPLNVIFGFFAAWAITRHSFRFKRFLICCLDIPFAVSPVISGMIFILLLGQNSLIGGFFMDHGMRIIFAPAGIVIVTTFITCPFVARELISVMTMQGTDQELAALSLGASPLQMFRLITLPSIKWGLFYGTILCTARAMGEFGAVSVVSGHIRGETNTLPLHVEILYNEYHFQEAFAVSTLLVFIAVVTLVIKGIAKAMAPKKAVRPIFRERQDSLS
ncbi:MAG: sulfate ABC transporter permease subunit CysW [Deltaproteobacteria bacterium]|nr:sulfate ABC transporter permease subunit CysW [Deltaproteobacteria bacterium]